MLGTLGNFFTEADRSEVSLLLLRFRFSLPDLGVAAAGTDCPAEISLDPLSDFEGFEEEHRRWCARIKTGVVLGVVEAKEDTMPV